MTTTTSATDKRTGVSLLFGILAVVAAIYMLVSAGQVARATGFGLAMAFAALAIAAVHLYE